VRLRGLLSMYIPEQCWLNSHDQCVVMLSNTSVWLGSSIRTHNLSHRRRVAHPAAARQRSNDRGMADRRPCTERLAVLVYLHATVSTRFSAPSQTTQGRHSRGMTTTQTRTGGRRRARLHRECRCGQRHVPREHTALRSGEPRAHRQKVKRMLYLLYKLEIWRTGPSATWTSEEPPMFEQSVRVGRQGVERHTSNNCTPA